MEETILSLSALCMFAALFEQLIHRRSAMFALRMVLGIEIFRTLLVTTGNWLSKIF